MVWLVVVEPIICYGGYISVTDVLCNTGFHHSKSTILFQCFPVSLLLFNLDYTTACIPNYIPMYLPMARKPPGSTLSVRSTEIVAAEPRYCLPYVMVVQRTTVLIIRYQVTGPVTAMKRTSGRMNLQDRDQSKSPSGCWFLDCSWAVTGNSSTRSRTEQRRPSR